MENEKQINGVDESRRKFLQTAGKAAAVAPAAALLLSQNVNATDGGGSTTGPSAIDIYCEQFPNAKICNPDV